MENGKCNWIFPDGDLPPQGIKEPLGHEALIITNANSKDADLTIDLLFEDKEPILGINLCTLKGMRVICIRLDQPLGKQKMKIPMGQYSLILRSNIPVVACFGRLDVRQENLAYYSVNGYSF